LTTKCNISTGINSLEYACTLQSNCKGSHSATGKSANLTGKHLLILLPVFFYTAKFSDVLQDVPGLWKLNLWDS